jgi:hypothetical protein
MSRVDSDTRNCSTVDGLLAGKLHSIELPQKGTKRHNEYEEYAMSVIRLGSTQKFSENWDNIFGGGKKSKSAPLKAGNGKRKAASKKVAKAKRGKK